MRNKKYNFFYFLLVALSVSSCSGGLDLHIVKFEDKTFFNIEKSGFSHRNICVYDVSVLYDEAVIWAINSSPECIELSSITYGEVPDGFSETVKSTKLIEGNEYFIRATGYGWNGQRKWVSR